MYSFYKSENNHTVCTVSVPLLKVKTIMLYVRFYSTPTSKTNHAVWTVSIPLLKVKTFMLYVQFLFHSYK